MKKGRKLALLNGILGLIVGILPIIGFLGAMLGMLFDSVIIIVFIYLMILFFYLALFSAIVLGIVGLIVYRKESPLLLIAGILLIVGGLASLVPSSLAYGACFSNAAGILYLVSLSKFYNEV